jgi:DNA polymerase V
VDPETEYRGEVSKDRYGRMTPKHAHGTSNLSRQSAAASLIIAAALEVYERTVDSSLTIRRLSITANHIVPEKDADNDTPEFEQLSFFTDHDEKERLRKEEDERLEKEKSIQLAEIKIKEKFGNNAILKGTSYLDSATGRDRNRQIGGHRA